MSESALHMMLVNRLADWIENSLLGGDSGYILIDNPDRRVQDKPPIVYGFIPDVYVMNAPGHGIIIGEAKTTRDVENNHSIEQYQAFLQKCAELKDSLFVLAVPWYMIRLAESILKELKKKIGAEEVTTKVLEKLPG